MESIISRKDARQKGLTQYFTGKPCKHEHISKRQVVSGSCISCAREATKQWLDNYPERRSLWIQNNLHRYRLYAQTYATKNKQKIKLYQHTKQRKITIHRSKQKHSDNINAYNAQRRSAKLKATPIWLSDQDFIEIKTFYQQAKNLQKQTCTSHQVDHIIPLKHDLVCGLHVSWNLQIITRSENATKKNKFYQDRESSIYCQWLILHN